jgi:hypothetical protein
MEKMGYALHRPSQCICKSHLRDHENGHKIPSDLWLANEVANAPLTLCEIRVKKISKQ